MSEKIHHGRNIKRFREMMGIKQEALAHELGADWSQKKISLLEQKEEVEDELLRQVAEILKVPAEAIKSFDEDQVVNIISNTFNDQSNGYNYYPTFNINPLEKWLESLEEIKRLNEDKIALYERMLKEKDEMMARLEKLVGK